MAVITIRRPGDRHSFRRIVSDCHRLLHTDLLSTSWQRYAPGIGVGITGHPFWHLFYSSWQLFSAKFCITKIRINSLVDFRHCIVFEKYYYL